MNMLAAFRPADLRECHVRLAASPAAPAQARSEVRAAICAWDACVDGDLAVLLTSELVTNAVAHEPGETITLVISCSRDRLRVDVHDSSQALPVLQDAAGDDETGRGLMLVATLSAEWGFSRTPGGKAVYFTLDFQSELASRGVPGPREAPAWGL
jgi:anti-sigma regulatory factor (Ser/Thr protein kinase)